MMKKTWKKKSLVVMAKAPIKGEVKTRLIPWLGEKGAYELYRCLLQDRLEEVSKLLGVDLYVACFPFEKKNLIEKLIPLSAGQRIKILSQEGEDLGERIMSVLHRFNFEKGEVALIDTDTPFLTAELLERGFEMLDRFELVVGPTDDGGYYFLGLRQLYAELFYKIPWGTSRVLSATLRKAKDLKINVKLLPTLRDIDEKEDALTFYFSGKRNPSIRTFTFLEKILKNTKFFLR
jgi:hypothetical protein